MVFVTPRPQQHRLDEAMIADAVGQALQRMLFILEYLANLCGNDD